eukprot:1855603-Alexandrium_andersonii.AAC.1
MARSHRSESPPTAAAAHACGEGGQLRPGGYCRARAFQTRGRPPGAGRASAPRRHSDAEDTARRLALP